VLESFSLWFAPLLVSFMIWFLIPLLMRAAQATAGSGLHLVVKATSFEPKQHWKIPFQGFVVGSIRIPMTLLHTNIADQKPLRLPQLADGHGGSQSRLPGDLDRDSITPAPMAIENEKEVSNS